jgi:lipopolysaccharide/colanic/teichoic acid biosynthesis glycosyltransferase
MVFPELVLGERPTWMDSMRTVLEGAFALGVLALSAPLWAMLWMEARRAGQADILVLESRIARTRRRGQRRVQRDRMQIDRRSIERRTQDLLGERIRCARFRSDLGPVSRWVYRHRLTTLPYLLNVIRGEMALVGPRPEREEFVLRWKGAIAEFERRFTVLPGVTGLAQVSGCGNNDLEAMKRCTQYDLYYVEHRSFVLDLRTLYRTISILLGPPREVPMTEAEVAAAAAVR